MKKGRNKEQHDALERFFSGMEVIESPADLRVFASVTDKNNATRGDEKRCVLAQACRRLYGSSAVLIFKRVAYIDLPDENGIRRVNRFTVSEKTRKQIIAYDETGDFPPGGFTFSKPSPARTLEDFRAKLAQRKRRIKSGEHKVDPKRSAIMKGVVREVKRAALITGVRDGSGMVHFVKQQAA